MRNCLISGINFLVLSIKLTSSQSLCLWLDCSSCYHISLCLFTTDYAACLQHVRRDAAWRAGLSAKASPCMHRLTVIYVHCALLCTLGFIRGGLLKITLQIIVRSLYFDILFLAVHYHIALNFISSASDSTATW